MKKYNMMVPEGTRDILPDECREIRSVQKKLMDIFTKRGYKEVMTPGLEYYDVFNIDGGEIPQHEMYKTTDNYGRLIVVRPDLTLPIARLTSTRLKNSDLPIRLCYDRPVYRNRPDLSGRTDESRQAGIELMGAKGIKADFEVITMAIECLKGLVSDFRIEIGHAGIFKRLLSLLNISGDHAELIRTTIESKNYGTLGDILVEVPDSQEKKALLKLPRLFGGDEVFAEAEKLMKDNEIRDILDYLKKLYNLLCNMGVKDNIMIDLGLVQRNDYYSGVVFSAYAQGHGDAVLMGGRYDSLLTKFGNPMAAVGFACEVEAITKIRMNFEGIKKEKTPKILVHGDTGYETETEFFIKELLTDNKVVICSMAESREDALAYAEKHSITDIYFVSAEVEKV